LQVAPGLLAGGSRAVLYESRGTSSSRALAHLPVDRCQASVDGRREPH